jgi:hypothetical protein
MLHQALGAKFVVLQAVTFSSATDKHLYFLLVGSILLRNVYIKIYQVNHNIQLYCDSPEDGPEGPKHVVK